MLLFPAVVLSAALGALEALDAAIFRIQTGRPPCPHRRERPGAPHFCPTCDDLEFSRRASSIGPNGERQSGTIAGLPPDDPRRAALGALDAIARIALVPGLDLLRELVRLAVCPSASDMHAAESVSILTAVQGMLRRSVGLPAPDPDAGNASAPVKTVHPAGHGYDFDAPPPRYQLEQVPDLFSGDRRRWVGFRPGGVVAAVNDEHPVVHTALWAEFMLNSCPFGYAVRYLAPRPRPWFEDPRLQRLGGWEWARLTGTRICSVAETEAQALAAAWSDFHQRDAGCLLDLLLALGEWPANIIHSDAAAAARTAWILGWSLLERGSVADWAVRVLAEHTVIPVRPRCLDRDRPAEV